ncbi:transposase family protein [Nonomuraea sp. FMUSA5-5]|uniref:Transposase family protein n=1 Tax=Nonomuraea composti TaxID=2720023 RepID=A0ABX1BL01_9ACTN|nr:transposase family protein [Nonomuraea sp. FMUSA5-5]
MRTYLASQSTMYRILRQHGEVGRDRRRQASHPPRAIPELVADAPNVVWAWDITKLRGPDKGVWYSLYTIIDLFSRYVVGWMVASRESADLARHLIGQTAAKHDIDPGSLTLHADRGSSMTSKSLAELLINLGVTKSHSLPRTSNDNPRVEASFKTLEYCPAFHAGSAPLSTPGLLPGVLHLVQPRALPLRDRLPPPGRRALRPRRRRPRPARRRAGRRPRHPSRTVRQRRPHPAGPARPGLDQQAQDHRTQGRYREDDTELAQLNCLKTIDRFRSESARIETIGASPVARFYAVSRQSPRSRE